MSTHAVADASFRTAPYPQAMATPSPIAAGYPVRVSIGSLSLSAVLVIPRDPRGLVILPNGDGDGIYRRSNVVIAHGLNDAGFATLAVELLTPAEREEDAETSMLRFDMSLLATRIVHVTRWARARAPLGDLEIGVLAGGLCAGAALAAAAVSPIVRAVVCHGARFERAATLFARIRAAVLLIVGEHDITHRAENERALASLPNATRLVVVEQAGHLIDEPSELSCLTRHVTEWLSRTLARVERTDLRPQVAASTT